MALPLPEGGSHHTKRKKQAGDSYSDGELEPSIHRQTAYEVRSPGEMLEAKEMAQDGRNYLKLHI